MTALSAQVCGHQDLHHFDTIFEREHRFVEALTTMSYDNPAHRPILDAEGLQRWLPPHLDGYDALRRAAADQGFFATKGT